MYARVAAAVLLLVSSACLVEAGEALEFPNYLQATATLPGNVTEGPVIAGPLDNYAVAAVGDSVYHIEMRHGRIHGRTGLSAPVTDLSAGPGGCVFALAGAELFRIDSFEVTAEVQLNGGSQILTTCGGAPLLVMEDGSIQLRDPDDLSLMEQGGSLPEQPVAASGFQGMVSVGYGNGTMETYSVPGFTRIARAEQGGEILFLEGTAGGKLLFSCSDWNEMASCSPEDLEIEAMFTFPEAPVDAAADSSLTFAFAVVPGNGVQVCRPSGEIAWRSGDYADDAGLALAPDRETALISTGSRIDILVR